MKSRFHGQVALVTGGASGIGAATVRRFVEEGARVVIADVQADAGAALANEMRDACRFVCTDVTNEQEVADAIDTAISAFGRLDVVFANAGVIGAVGPLVDSRMPDVDKTFAINLRGTFLTIKHAARVMQPRKRGVILATTSPAAVIGGIGPHAYSAAKAAIVGLVQSVAAELRPHNIRVNAIMPGAIVTAMTADLTVRDARDIEGARGALQASALMNRPGLPEDIAAAALFLASDDASFVTGCTLPVDAGMTTAGGTAPFSTGAFGQPSLVLEAGRRG